MSRIGKKSIPITGGVNITLDKSKITVKGPKGEISLNLHPNIIIDNGEKEIIVKRTEDSKFCRSLHGLHRSLIANMIEGVTKGFARKMEINGIGYRGTIQGKKMVLNLGFSHAVEFIMPEGIAIEFDKEKKNIFTIMGIDKQLVGETAAKIRALRKPEPYKGKGIKYFEERIVRKAGKTATGAKE